MKSEIQTRRRRFSLFEFRHCFGFRFSDFVISCFVFCLATIRPPLASGGLDQLPAPSSSREFSFSLPKETSLTNGLRVIVAERPGLPLLAARVVIKSGGEADPQNLAGVARMTGSLLTKGTERMSAPQIASAIESLGGEIESDAHWDSSSAAIVVMSDKAEVALSILSDVIVHPTFRQEEIDRQKNQTLDSLRVALQQPGSLAQFVTERVIFGSAEYGHSLTGTLETVAAIRREDLLEFYKAHYAPQNAALILSGNVTLEQGKNFAQKFFGDWKVEAPAAAGKKLADTDQENLKPSNVVVDMPEAGQAAVVVAEPMIKRDSPDYYPGLVANAALGNGFISRLNREIRIKRGLSYGARSSLEARREVGPFSASAQTKNQSAAEVARLLESEMKRIGNDPVQGEELKSRQAVLTGGYARHLETNQGVSGTIAALVANGLPLDLMNKFISSIDAVTSENVSAFAAKYFATPPSLIVVGKAADFLESLRKSFAEVKVIPQAELDLNRSDLTKRK